MKTLWLTLLALVGPLASAQGASLFEIAYPVASGLLPDGDLNGRVDVRRVSGVGGTITDVDVWVDIRGVGYDGGWVGDLYGALRHESGYAVLLNRPGRSPADAFGVSGTGITGWFDDAAAAGDVHLLMDVDGEHSGTWQPDGRLLLPTAPAGEFDEADRPALLGTLVGLPVDGDWTLWLVDASSGGRMELREWGLRIAYDPAGSAPGDPGGPGAEVPEASAGWVAAALLAVGVLRRRGVRRRSSAPGL